MSQSVLDRHHVNVIGHGDRVLMLAHGLGCDQGVWEQVVRDLSRDHRVVLFDYVGSGASDTRAWHPDRYATLDGHARDVLEILDALQAPPVVFIGHSVSCSIGVLAAVASPERFERLILVAPNPCFVNEPGYVGGYEMADIIELLDLMERNVVGWANFFAPVAMKNPDRPELVDDFRQRLCNGDPVILKHFTRVVFLSDVRDQLPRLQVPALILQCDDDAVAPKAVGEYMQAHMPRASLKHMRATGHCPHMSQPGETVSMIRDYLSEGAF